MSRIHVTILKGGVSPEHEVSLTSAKEVFRHLDKDLYTISEIYIDRQGLWHKEGNVLPLGLALDAWIKDTDVVFPVLHGPNGEDGTIQGVLELLGVSYVGAGVLGSSVGMDKFVMKTCFSSFGLNIARYILQCKTTFDSKQVLDELGLPCFVKPCCSGSSFGIHLVTTKEELDFAANDAFSYCDRIIIEERIAGRELECSVLGLDHPITSVVGEIVPRAEYYTREAKLCNGADLLVPANISPSDAAEIKRLAIEAFRSTGCDSMARVDFFLSEEKGILVNEINTIPGFTPTSLYPKLWEASGLPFKDLLDHLIEIAQEKKYRRKQQLSYESELSAASIE